MLQDLEELYVKYKSKLEELLSLQKKCQSGINHQRYRLKAIRKQMGHVKAESDEEKTDLQDLNKDLLRRSEQLSQVILELNPLARSSFEFESGHWLSMSKLERCG